MKTQNILLGILIAIALAVAFMFYQQTEKAINAYICDSNEIIVNEGVTLYAIVQAQCDGNLSEALDDVVDIYGTNLSVGQRIFLPQNNEEADLWIDAMEPCESDWCDTGVLNG